MITPHGLGGIKELFGPPILRIEDPRLDSLEIASWYPKGIPLAWNPEQAVTRIRCHNMVVGPLIEALDELKGMECLGLIKTYGGGWAYREKTGGGELSTHSWGIAIDLNPGTNPYGHHGDMPWAVVKAFATAGWTWGGAWAHPDPMHFQLATGF